MVETARASQPTGTKPQYYYGLGRRKTAVARVRLYPGSGQILINGRPASQYFGNRLLYRVMITEPLRLTGLQDHFDIRARVVGGGISGQAGAVRHGVARALLRFNPELRPVLKRAGLLTRDPRVKERMKPGLKRARKAPQYTKR
ncbi:30S ribosomal protein S9 [Thermomicrobium roseum]|uniref:Small ribosomal subunit protein uS9 n=1 Tax=Thermomicrobium roseum (strain ATCC 27502 / DSM 5159 / P-2) TaxID=309801 RepID=B9KZV6_THERP|nr:MULTISPECIES: 30S ribosomal protein S9 [Thermomicrobium]ACM05327.1 ribosomal protein S9 [Thermomicrobium roseum DSM 5159]MBO9306500.1 30S ribosomal protein S9 [Thermomicrobium sp.]MBO9350835.1 30S ribosomal protein S9 [Thermomicrobium sp.]MBO9359766.1 30S ribosomal protein S9 [Thermomicrobium sp.]MBO9385393.1 30S ribosomal protein S9 [Thermomicrobium sp.]